MRKAATIQYRHPTYDELHTSESPAPGFYFDPASDKRRGNKGHTALVLGRGTVNNAEPVFLRTSGYAYTGQQETAEYMESSVGPGAYVQTSTFGADKTSVSMKGRYPVSNGSVVPGPGAYSVTAVPGKYTDAITIVILL
jgi:hypothetical protein